MVGGIDKTHTQKWYTKTSTLNFFKPRDGKCPMITLFLLTATAK